MASAISVVRQVVKPLTIGKALVAAVIEHLSHLRVDLEARRWYS